MKKNSCTPINPTKYSCYGLKNSYKEFDNEKKFLRLENSPPLPHNFSNGRSMNRENREHQYCVARKKPIRRKSVCGFVASFLLRWERVRLHLYIYT